MTAGSGILHQEMPKASEKMLGFQLWLNLPQKEKMCEPAYLGITRDMIPRVKSGNAEIGVLAGRFGDAAGVTPKHIPASVYDVSLPQGEAITIPTPADETVFVFLIDGNAVIGGKQIPSKTAVLFDSGDFISVGAPSDSALRFIFFSGKALHEPIAWGGPIVMNTEDELEQAFRELQNGSFIRHG